MTFWSALWRIELRTLLAVLAAAGLMAGYMFFDSMRTSYTGTSGWAWIGFAGTLVFGLPVAAIYGAPLYTYLHRTSSLSWPRVLLVGALPAAPMAVVDREVALLFLICGVFVAGLTHALVLLRPLTRHWSRP